MTQLKTVSVTCQCDVSVLYGQDVVNWMLSSCLPPAETYFCYNTTLDTRIPRKKRFTKLN